MYIKGVRIRKEPSSSTPKTPDRNGKFSSDVSSTRDTEGSSGSFLGPSKAKKIRGTGYTVAVEGVPLHIPLSEVKKALSKYGEITSSSRKQVGHGDCVANVEFKVIPLALSVDVYIAEGKIVFKLLWFRNFFHQVFHS